MFLYSTSLLIEGRFIPYEVFREGSRLFYKPSEKFTRFDRPLFWVAKVEGVWIPLNVEDEKFVKQVQDDILKHKVEV
jgi:hypothetical protein